MHSLPLVRVKQHLGCENKFTFELYIDTNEDILLYPVSLFELAAHCLVLVFFPLCRGECPSLLLPPGGGGGGRADHGPGRHRRRVVLLPGGGGRRRGAGGGRAEGGGRSCCCCRRCQSPRRRKRRELDQEALLPLLEGFRFVLTKIDYYTVEKYVHLKSSTFDLPAPFFRRTVVVVAVAVGCGCGGSRGRSCILLAEEKRSIKSN